MGNCSLAERGTLVADLEELNKTQVCQGGGGETYVTLFVIL